MKKFIPTYIRLVKPGVVALTFNPSPGEARSKGGLIPEFKTSLVYTESFKLARVTK